MIVCLEEGCEREGRYRYAKEKEDKLRCRVHRGTRKIDIKRQDCFAEGCKAKGRYRFIKKDFDGLYCAKHRNYKSSKRRNIDEGRELCEICFDTRATYGLEKDPLPSRCTEHKTEGMVSKHDALCTVKGCKTRATYAKEGTKKPIYCAEHRDQAKRKNPKVNYVDSTNRTCQGITKAGKKCSKNAIYNFPWETAGIFCRAHKVEGMENVKDRKCNFGGCKTIPGFGYLGERPRRCALHKLEDMEDLKNRKCAESSCKVIPNFNYPDQKCGLFCDSHRKEGMINVRSPKCQHEGCTTTANYNVSEAKFGIYCSVHAKSNMKDIKNKRCSKEKCEKIVCYGFVGENPILCTDHREEGMIKNPRKRCIYKDVSLTSSSKRCKNYASYGKQATKQLYCADHAPNENYVCLTTRKCVNAVKSELCLVVDVLYNGKCRACDPEGFFKYNRKAKEIEVKEWLDNSKEHSHYVSYDRSFPEIKECFDRRYRPDFLYDCGTHFVILEVDENQHRVYECERKRMWEIAQSLGLPTIFIRYNPDAYKSKYRDYHKTYNPLPCARKKMLFHVLEFAKNAVSTQESEYLRIIKLYYDGFDKTIMVKPILFRI
jgi:hypothetical protein